MTIYFVTRHPGALEWAKLNRLKYDIHLTHLTEDIILCKGDIIIGTLPINIVYNLNQKGIRYIHLSLEIPAHLRGIELSVEQLNDCKATLEEYTVIKLN